MHQIAQVRSIYLHRMCNQPYHLCDSSERRAMPDSVILRLNVHNIIRDRWIELDANDLGAVARATTQTVIDCRVQWLLGSFVRGVARPNYVQHQPVVSAIDVNAEQVKVRWEPRRVLFQNLVQRAVVTRFL